MLADAPTEDDLDGGPKKSAAERFCAVSRQAKPTDEMIRFVLSPDRTVVPDVRRKLPGRGLWVTATRQMVDEAVRRGVFARGFKTDVRADPGLTALTEGLLERAALDALAIAGKAGLVLSGFGKTEDAIGREKVIGLLHAVEAAADGKRKIGAVLRRFTAESGGETGPEIPVIEAFSTDQLDLALGRSNVVHAALLAGSASDTFVARASRLESFRTGAQRGPTAIKTHVK